MSYPKHQILADLKPINICLVDALLISQDIKKSSTCGLGIDINLKIEDALTEINEIANKLVPDVAKLKRRK